MIPALNREIARRLKEVAELLHNQGSNPFRAQAYRYAAQTLEQLERPVDDILRAEGVEGLQKLPGIGESLSQSIRELVFEWATAYASAVTWRSGARFPFRLGSRDWEKACRPVAPRPGN